MGKDIQQGTGTNLVPVIDLPVSESATLTCWLFDPFNVPFDRIAIQTDPCIDLSSQMRVKYKEIRDYL